MSGIEPVVLVVCAALCCGLLLALLGTLKLTLARQPERVGTKARRLLSLLNVLLLPLFALAGLLTDVVGPRPVIVTASVLLTLSFVALGGGVSYPRTVTALIAAVVGAAMLLPATIVLLPYGLFGSHEAMASIQFGMALFAFGALIGSPLFDLLHQKIGVRRTTALLALVMLVPALLCAMPQAVPTTVPQGGEVASLLDLLSGPGLWMAALVLFFYAPLEGFVTVWAVSYLKSIGQPQREGTILGAFWMAVLASRVATALALHMGNLSGYGSWVLVVGALFVAVVFGALSNATTARGALRKLILLGCILGPLYPAVVGMELHETTNWQASAFAALHAGGSLGGFALAPLVGFKARSENLQFAMRLPLFAALAMTVAALLFALVGR